MRSILFATVAAAMLPMATTQAAAAPACATRATDEADVAAAVHGFYAAIKRGDMAGAAALTNPGFHAFDVAKAFTGPELFAMVGGAIEKGVTFEFGIDKVEAHVACDSAWAVWKNDGKVGTTPTVWLESAMFSRTPKGWRFDFYHSTKVPAPAAH